MRKNHFFATALNNPSLYEISEILKTYSEKVSVEHVFFTPN